MFFEIDFSDLTNTRQIGLVIFDWNDYGSELNFTSVDILFSLLPFKIQLIPVGLPIFDK